MLATKPYFEYGETNDGIKPKNAQVARVESGANGELPVEEMCQCRACDRAGDLFIEGVKRCSKGIRPGRCCRQYCCCAVLLSQIPQSLRDSQGHALLWRATIRTTHSRRSSLPPESRPKPSK